MSMKTTIISSMTRRKYKRHIRDHNERTHTMQSERVAEENALSREGLQLPETMVNIIVISSNGRTSRGGTKMKSEGI